jgi:Tfp pilus assembly protein PilO
MQKKTVWMIAFSLLFLIATSTLYVWGYTSIHELKSEEMVFRGEMQAWVKKGKQMTSFYSVLDEARRVSALFAEEHFFPSEEKQIQLITALEQLAQKFGLTAEIRSLESAADYSKVSGVIACSGSYAALMEYLQAVEVFPYRVAIDEISIQTKSGQYIQPKQTVEAILTFHLVDIQKPLTP